MKRGLTEFISLIARERAGRIQPPISFATTQAISLCNALLRASKARLRRASIGARPS
jgi:hypothetical protein